MNQRNRTQLALGIILLLASAWLVISKVQPEWTRWITLSFEWPMWVIIAGGIVLLIGLLTGAAGMAIPACITAGVGGILYYQNLTSDWESWSYIWSLIPGFVGIGIILSSLLEGTFRREFKHALNLMLISIILFLIFGAAFGGLDILGQYKDYILAGLLLLVGLWFIARGLYRRRKES